MYYITHIIPKLFTQYDQKVQGSHGTNLTVNVPGQSAELLLATVVDIPVSIAGAEAWGLVLYKIV